MRGSGVWLTSGSAVSISRMRPGGSCRPAPDTRDHDHRDSADVPPRGRPVSPDACTVTRRTGPSVNPASSVTGSLAHRQGADARVVYARRLANLRLHRVHVRFSGFGESEGEPRQTAVPDQQNRAISSPPPISSATLDRKQSTRSRLTHVAVCASARSGLAGAGARLPSHPASSASPAGFTIWRALAGFYERRRAGIAERLDAAEPGHPEGSRRPVSSRMVPAYPRRGHVGGDVLQAGLLRQRRVAAPCRPGRNEMATLSWTYWFLLDGLRGRGPGVGAGPVRPLGRVRLSRQPPFGARSRAWSEAARLERRDADRLLRSTGAGGHGDRRRSTPS